MQDVRRSYADRMEEEREKAERDKEEKRAREMALEIIFGVPAGSMSCSLLFPSSTPRLLTNDQSWRPSWSIVSAAQFGRVERPLSDSPCGAVWKNNVVMVPFGGGKAACRVPL